MRMGGLAGRNVGAAFGVATFLGAVLAAGLRKNEGVVPQIRDRGDGLMKRAANVKPAFAEVSEEQDWVEQLLRSNANESRPSDRARVWQFIQECGASSSVHSEVNWPVVDEAFFWLRGATHVPDEIEKGLIEIGSATNASQSVRCFALQHLGIWSDENLISDLTIGKLREVAYEGESGGAGALALAVLNSLRASSADADWLRARIWELLKQPDTCVEQCLMALHTAVDLKMSGVEILVRKFVAVEQRVSVRVGAYFALGSLGNAETLRWIKSQPVPPDALVREARERALGSLVQRAVDGF